MEIDNANRNLRLLPELVDREPLSFADIVDVVCDSDGLGFLNPTKDEELENSFGLTTVDRRFALLGVDQNALVEETVIGEVFVAATEVAWELNNCGIRKAPPISIQPAYAALTTDAVDRNHVQAMAAVNACFAEGNEPKMTSRDVSWLKTCVSTNADPTRVFFRFAQMYYYYLQLEKQGVAARPTPATSNPIHIRSVAHVLTTLRNGASGTHFLPFDLDSYTGDHTVAATILRYVAEGSAWPLVAGAEVSSILALSMRLPNVEVLLTGSVPVNIVNPNFTATDIWDLMFNVAGQLDCEEILKEMLTVVAAQMYSVTPDVDPVFRSPLVRFALPPLQMSYYAIFPVALAADKIVHTTVPEEREVHVVACELILRSQLLSIAYREMLWTLGLGGKFRSPQHAAKAARWRRNLTSRGRKPYAPMWGIMAKYLEKHECSVCLSKTAITFAPDQSAQSVRGLQNILDACSSWVDVLDVVPKAPMAALDAYTKPKKSATLLQPGVRYKLDLMTNENLPSVVHALENQGGVFELIHKLKTSLNWTVERAPVLKGKYGTPADRPFQNMMVDNHVQSHFTVRLPNAQAAVALHNGNLIKKEWKWYIQGAGPRTDNDTFDDNALGPSGTSDLPNDVQNGPPGGIDNTPSSDPPLATDFEVEIERLIGDLTRVRTVADEVRAEQTPPPQKAAPEALSRQAQWDYDDMMLVAPGILQQMASHFKAYQQGVVKGTGRSDAEHFTPLVAPLANSLEQISFCQAVANVPKGKRVATMNATSRVLRTFASVVDVPSMSKKLCFGAQRALATAKALKICPALTLAELAEEGQVWNEEAADLIDMLGQTAVESGIALSEFTGPKPVGVDVRGVKFADVVGYEADKWRKARDQKRAKTGEVVMTRPKRAIIPKSDWESVSMMVATNNDEILAKADAMLDALEVSDAGSETEVRTDSPAKTPLVVELPEGMEKAASLAGKLQTELNERNRVYVAQIEEVQKQISFFKMKQKDYNDPVRKEYVHSKALALEVALENATTVNELHDAMIDAIGQPEADFGRAGAPLAATLAGSLEQPTTIDETASVASDVTDEDALGPMPPRSPVSPPVDNVDPSTLADLTML